VSTFNQKAASAAAWTEVGWPDEAVQWIESHIGVIGPLRWRKPKPWSSVACTETPDGVFWFKQVGSACASEPALTAALARRAPEVLPEVVAAEGMRLLTRHAGPHLGHFIRHSGTAPTTVLEGMVASFAQLEIALAPFASRLPSFDARPQTLARSIGEMVTPLVDALGDTIPLSLVHLDLFKKNVCVRGDHFIFLDWAVPAYAHPFCGLHVVLRALVRDFRVAPGGREVLRVRDAYLEPWTSYAPMGELRRIFAAANPLGALCRVMRWQELLKSVPAGIRGAYTTGADKWLESFRSSLDAPDRLGL
jgi:hypothetical protein